MNFFSKALRIGIIFSLLFTISCEKSADKEDKEKIPSVPDPPALSVINSTRINASWSFVSGATSYKLYRDISASGSYSTKIYEGTNTFCQDTGLNASTAYYYKLEACNGAGCSDKSNYASKTTPAPPVVIPDIPPGVPNLFVISSTQINASWTAVNGATYYKLYRDISANGSYSTKVYEGNNTSYQNTGLNVSATYYYKLEACNGAGCSNKSNYASETTNTPPVVIPDIPPGVPNLFVISSTQINASWTAVNGATYYKLYRDTSASGSYSNKVYEGTNISYQNTGLNAGTAYYYKLEACNSAGCSIKSNYASEITIPPVPGVPNLSVVSSAQINISWTAVAGATSYKLYRNLSADGSYNEVYSGSDTSHQNTGLDSGTVYYYKLEACNSAGCSNKSGYSSAITIPSVPAPPNLSVISSTQINASWIAVSGATFYKLYRAISAGGSYSEIYSGSNISYQNTGLSPGIAYYYKLETCNSSGCSDKSAYSSTITKWTRLLGTSEYEYGHGVALDSDGNIYITGYTTGDLDGNGNQHGHNNTFLVKYDSSGDKQWTRELGNSEFNNRGHGVALDSSDNIYITGDTYGDLDGNINQGMHDIFLVKYDSSGDKQWTRQLGTSSSERGYGVALDSSGNIYITGDTRGDLDGNTNQGYADTFLLKYNFSGNKLWTRQLGSSDSDVGYSVASDSSGNIYITGMTSGNLDGSTKQGSNDIFLVKYDASGDKQWTRLLGTSSAEFGYGVALDSSDNIYIAGRTQGNLDGNTNQGSNDIFLVKYDSSGDKQWTRQLGSSDSDVGYSVASDNSDNIYITGWTQGNLDGNTNQGMEDIFLVKYDASGDKQWTRSLGTSGYDTGRGVALDSFDNIYITGCTNGDLDGNTNQGACDIFLIKYNLAGERQ